MSRKKIEHVYDVIVVGAGAAGVGLGVALRYAGVKRFGVIERDRVGASFAAWPAETRFITPSFPTNSIGMIDLNAVAPGASPAHNLGVEHPTGMEYAMHLRGVAKHFKVPVREKTEVQKITPKGDIFHVETGDHILQAKHVVWAAGEFQYPKKNGFAGAELCRHTATIPTYRGLEGDEFIVVGGYESGVDAAYHLAVRQKRVKLFDAGSPWTSRSSEPSVALSPFTLERMRSDAFAEYVELFPNAPIASVSRSGGSYEVITGDGECFDTKVPPLLAHGFEGSHKLVSHLFEMREDGYPLLNENDESTTVPGVFLCGPAVRHNNYIFCFIYKYRQRFAVVAKTIATRLGLPATQLEGYRSRGMFLDDLSCCGDECEC